MLGPLLVRSGAGWTRIAAGRQRLVLAVLLIHAGRTVSTEQLADVLWGARPPRTAANTVAAYVMRLRRVLGGDALLTRGSGYELAAGEGEIDADVFERSLACGRRELRRGRLEAGAARLAQALRLWQGSGPALADLPETPVLAARVAHLEQLRLGAVEDEMGALLDLGQHGEVVEELRRLAEESPLRERRWELLMAALARCGRRAEALETYQRARRVLRAELGVEPGARLCAAQRRVLAGDRMEVGWRPAGRPETERRPPAQLPAGVAGFTGRAGQLARLDALLPAANAPAVVATLTGPAGVGKTALAACWGHRVRDRFPGGQLYVHLHGHGERPPMPPAEALAGFLRALGASRVPADVGEASALYRSLLDGRRVLVLLDDARDAAQVRPLLPGSHGCVALVTSRDRLTGLVARDGARPMALGVMSDREARDLLTGLLADRAAADPEAAMELARLCGNLPMALRAAAANLTSRPHEGIAAYAAALAADRLGGLEVDGDPHSGVRGAFDASYATLGQGARLLFRQLGAPGPADVTAAEAATLIGGDVAAAARLLRELAAAHLVEEHATGRYGMPDLLRVYAAEKASGTGPARSRRATSLYGAG
ncbi:AfsR/SARP family transcriptional regulator [Nonomuraea zeae]|nr:AfsR/SARP family transcriptional regulator [Nonomuraea zeae]